MGLLARIKQALTPAGTRMQSGVWGSRAGDPPVRGTKQFLEVYETSPWVRAVAGKTATAIGCTEWTLEGRGVAIKEHPLLKALRRPNPFMSGRQLFKLSQLSLDLVGDSFWLKGRNGLGVPVEFYPIPPHWIAETPTPAKPEFRVSYYGWQEHIPESEIFWMRDHTPSDPYRRGAGIVRAQSDELETYEYASKHAKQLFFNRAIPEFVVMDEGAGAEEIDRHDIAFNQKLQGLWRWYKPYFTNRKLEFWQPQQMNLENLTMVPLLKHERDTIIQTWGFPPEELGIVENSNRATAEASKFVFESRIVEPRREFMADSVNSFLVPEYDDRLTFGFVSTVPSDKTHQLAVASKAPHALTTDEWRGMAGLEPVGGDIGKSRLVPLNSFLAVDPLDPESRPQSAPKPAPGEKPDDPEADPENPKPEDEPEEVPA
jgi:hypothetical protein